MRDSGADRQKSASHHYAHKLPFQVENYILNVKREHTTWGARKIRERLIRRFSGIKIPAKSTIHALLDRHGFVERRGPYVFTSIEDAAEAGVCAVNPKSSVGSCARIALKRENGNPQRADSSSRLFTRVLDLSLPRHVFGTTTRGSGTRIFPF